MRIQKIEGLIAATFAAYNEDGSVNLLMIPTLVNRMINDGLTGIFICGTNGEGPNLTTEERMEIAEAYLKVAKGRIKIFVHVGHSSIKESKILAAHAQAIGADAISSVAAFYFKPTSVQNLVDCVAEIASAAPELPFYYYHIPALTGVAMDMIDFLNLGEKTIPNLAGIKYTAATLHEYQACLNHKDGKFDILFGYDEMLLGALTVGAKGAIGSTYTYGAPLYLALVNAFRQNDLEQAAKLQFKSVEMVRCIVKYSPIPAQRAIMKMLDVNLGECRLPLKPLTESESMALESSLNEISFFEAVESARPDYALKV